MNRMLMAVVAVSLAAAGAVAAGKIRKDKGLQQGEPGMNRWSAAEPGTTQRLPRAYDGAPATIPHGTDGLAITREANSCLDCHLDGMEVAEGHSATKIPASHFVNPKTGEKRTDTVLGMRYQCLQCHSPRAEGAAPPILPKP